MSKIFDPPHSLDAEQHILGAVMKDVGTAGRVFEVVQNHDMFYTPRHRLIYNACQKAWVDHSRIDMIVVSNELMAIGSLEKVGGRGYLVSLIEGVGSTARIDVYLGILKDKYLLRGILGISVAMEQASMADGSEGERLLGDFQKLIFDLSRSAIRNEPTPVGVIVKQIQIDIDHHQTNKKPRAGVVTGFQDVDAVVQAMRPSDLIIVAARPGMGKSAYAMAMAINIAKSGAGVGFFSLEMSKEQLGGRMISDFGSIPSDRLNSFNLTDQEWLNFGEAQAQIEKLPIWIDDMASISTMQLRAKIQRLKMRHNCSVFIVDYLQLMTTRKKTENKQQEIADISAQLKAIAKDTGSVIIACSQLSRLVESRPDKMPQLSDLRESGAIEQDADMVLMLYRPEYYAKEVEVKGYERNLCHVRIAKNRHGATGNAKLNFFGEYSRFTDRSTAIISASGTHYDV